MIWIKNFSYTLLYFNWFSTSGGKKTLGNSVQLLHEIWINKIDSKSTQNVKKHSKCNFQVNINQYKTVFKELRVIIFVINQKRNNYHAKNFKSIVIDFLLINISFSHLDTGFLYKIWLYCINFLLKLIKASIKYCLN